MDNINFSPRTSSTNSSKGWINIILTDDSGKHIQICGSQIDPSSKFLTREGKLLHSEMENLLDDMDNGEVLILDYPLHLEIRKTDPNAPSGVSINFRNAIRKK